MAVRRILPDEGERLRTLRLAALRDAPGAFASSYAREAAFPAEQWRDRAVAGASGNETATFVAEGAAGWSGMAVGFRDPNDRSLAHLVGMWVAPEARRGGVGRALVAAMVAWAGSAGADRIELWVVESNEAGRALYRSAGFVPTPTTQPLPSHPQQVERRWALHLGSVGERRTDAPSHGR